MYHLVHYRFIHILTTVVVPVLFLAIGIVGLLGNCMVVYVIVSQRRMRTVTNLMLLNLAASDIIFLCVCLPFRASALVMRVLWAGFGYLWACLDICLRSLVIYGWSYATCECVYLSELRR